MTIGEIVKQGFHYARTCKSLWLFGFVVGIASGGNGGGGRVGGVGGAAAGAASSGALPWPAIALIVPAIFLVAGAALVLRFVSEGALIEGVVRARAGGRMTTREGFRAGWAHWGVLVRIALLYLGATIATLGVVGAPCIIALRAFGVAGALATGIPALAIAVPWLVTLYLVQAFASRIAVLENRRAIDAVSKARLFLHGRLAHGLRLIVATLVGTLAFTVVALAAIAPVALALAAFVPVLRLVPVIVIACTVLLPAIFAITAMLGTFRSSVWTIGYLNQVES
jgi:hypothetical protein